MRRCSEPGNFGNDCYVVMVSMSVDASASEVLQVKMIEREEYRIGSGLAAMVVDDDVLMPHRILPRFLLKGTNFDAVFLVKSGEEAIKCYEANLQSGGEMPKIVFATVDRNMGLGINGADTIGRLERTAKEAKEELHMVGVTDDKDPAHIKEMLEAGAEKVFDKTTGYSEAGAFARSAFPFVEPPRHSIP